ncbi:MAG: hypothetical protein K2N12_05925 [Helicobacter sp.]|nr:hypothetical protein [Helicobacter sp.]
MEFFDNSEYTYLISELLHNAHYIKRSNRDKIRELGAYAEILVRKLLDIGNDYPITLGQIEWEYNKKKQTPAGNKLHGLDDGLRKKLFETIKRIAPLRNEASHTQHTEKFSDEEVAEVEDAILDLYALIFIQYFMDNKVSLESHSKAISGFSLLPPIIRYKTWKYLFERDKNNIQVVSKLYLSIIKSYGREAALEWLDENAETIRAIPVEKIRLGQYDNMYDLLLNELDNPDVLKNEGGKMYKDFEEAIKFYEAYKESIQDNSEEIKKFCSLMEFVYIGRKPK